MAYQHIIHPFLPLYEMDSRILILGTLPSVKSRENNFYYGHKQNRFWRVVSSLYNAPVPETISGKKALLISHHIALWDVIYSCDIQGSSDSSIRNVVPTDLKQIIAHSGIQRIYANGAKTGQLYHKYQENQIGMPIHVLPSTSPANAAWSLEQLCRAWSSALKIEPDSPF